MCFNRKNDTNKCTVKRVSGQVRKFLLLELLIALFLIGMCALPLARLPMKALQEEMNSAYRMHAQRLADLAFATLLEQLYTQEIPWKQIESPWKNRKVVLEDRVTVFIKSLGKKEFVRRATLHSVGKKSKEGDPWHLVTFRITIGSAEKESKTFRKPPLFTYQVLVGKSALPPTTTPAPAAAVVEAPK